MSFLLGVLFAISVAGNVALGFAIYAWRSSMVAEEDGSFSWLKAYFRSSEMAPCVIVVHADGTYDDYDSIHDVHDQAGDMAVVEPSASVSQEGKS